MVGVPLVAVAVIVSVLATGALGKSRASGTLVFGTTADPVVLDGALISDGESGRVVIQIFEGRIVAVTKGPFVMPSSAFALRAPSEEWDKFWSRRPPPGSNDLMALVKRRVLKAEGDLHVFMANLRYFKEALGKLRAGAAA